MLHYYNFTVSENHISFDPYWYDKSNLAVNFVLGIIILISGIVFSHLNDFKSGIILSILIASLLFINGIYNWKIKSKTTFLFNKTENAFYKITSFGKKKATELTNITSIITKSGSRNFNYILMVKKKNSTKKIYLTHDIKNSSQTNPEVRFLEMEIIPQLESFLNLKKDVQIIFDSEECSSI